MTIECPYLQRFHNILCFLTIIETQNTFPSPDYLAEKWISIIGDVAPIIPEDVDASDINDWEEYKRKWLWHFPVEDPFTERLKAIFLISSICSTYSSYELSLKEFHRFVVNFRSIKSNKSVGVHFKVRDYATKLLFDDCKELITGYVRELKMEDALND